MKQFEDDIVGLTRIERDTIKAELSEVKAQLVEARMERDFANAACERKDKRLAEYESVLAWATVNIRDLSNFRWIVSDDLNWSVTTKDYQSFTEPTLYGALHKAWEERNK